MDLFILLNAHLHFTMRHPDSGSKAITKALKERGKESHYLTIRIL